jgi:MFS family permease
LRANSFSVKKTGTIEALIGSPAQDAPVNARSAPSLRTLRGLDWLNFFLADAQTGVGPFLAIYLASYKWNEQSVGLALTVGGIAGIVTQTPAGALVDRLRSKRAFIAAGIVALAVGSLLIALMPNFWAIMTAQVLIGGTSSLFGPAICAISLGVVGRAAFDTRQGRNQTFNSAGNVTAAVLMGVLGYLVSNRSIFFFVVALAVPTLLMLLLIKPTEIDYEIARGAEDGDSKDQAKSVRVLLENSRKTGAVPPAPPDVPRNSSASWRRAAAPFALFQEHRLMLFLVCAVMFHFANAAMLPLLGEMLAKGQGRSSMMFMSACVVTTQFVVTLISSWTGRKAASWGRKPLLLIAFGVLPVRGVLYTLTHNTDALVAIQILDGVAAGIFGVVSVLVIADLTKGSGRFNLTLGAIGMAVGIGASMSQVIAGSIVHHVGSSAGFLFLAAVAAAAFAILYFFMPETHEI